MDYYVRHNNILPKPIHANIRRLSSLKLLKYFIDLYINIVIFNNQYLKTIVQLI